LARSRTHHNTTARWTIQALGATLAWAGRRRLLGRKVDTGHPAGRWGEAVNAQMTPSDCAGLEHYAPAIIRFSTWYILVCSPLYVGVIVLEGLLRPDYNDMTMFISELALGPGGFVQIANYIVFGLSILLFAIGVALTFGTTRAGRIGVTLLVIVGICSVAAGLFVIDPVPASGLTYKPGAIGPPDMSFSSKFHYVVSSLMFVLAPVCAFCFVFAGRFAKDAIWQAFRRWSLVLGIVMALGLILMKLATVPPPTNPLRPWRGLIQRVIVLPFSVWLFAFGAVLLKRRATSFLYAFTNFPSIALLPASPGVAGGMVRQLRAYAAPAPQLPAHEAPSMMIYVLALVVSAQTGVIAALVWHFVF
jgi:hypothetical protein